MTYSYSKAYTEVLSIIHSFPEEEYKKIPEDMITFLNKNKDNNYFFEFDTEKSYEEQQISREAYAILVLFYREYFSTASQKEYINSQLRKNQAKLEVLKRENYKGNTTLKKNNTISLTENKNNIEENNLVEAKKVRWYEKFVNFFKRITKK